MRQGHCPTSYCAREGTGANIPLAPEFTNERLRKLIYGTGAQDESEKPYKEPDYEHIHKEMAKSGVTLSLLWNEYCAMCRQEGSIPYMYSTYRQEGRTREARRLHSKRTEHFVAIIVTMP